jgi:hypothetical protein
LVFWVWVWVLGILGFWVWIWVWILGYLRTQVKPQYQLFLGSSDWVYITSDLFQNIIFQLYSTRAFDWCINCHNRFFTNSLTKKMSKTFPLPHMTIKTPIESPCRVEKMFLKISEVMSPFIKDFFWYKVLGVFFLRLRSRRDSMINFLDQLDFI